jgi:hypothetical protein
LAAEVKSAYAAASGAAAGSGKTPFGIEALTLPNGVAQTISCSSLASGGTGSVSVDTPAIGIVSGYTITITYNACSFSGYTYNGTATITYDSYVSATNYTSTLAYKNFSVSGPGVPVETVNGKVTCTINGSSTSCYYNDGSRGWSSTMTYANGTANGSYAANYGNGSVQVTFNNFNATGGTATVTGANGSKAVITRTSATSFTVVITPSTGAASTTYTVSA